MDCIGKNILSGDGSAGWISWFLQYSALIPKHQHRNEHGLSHGKSSALLGICWIDNWHKDAGSSMSYMRILKAFSSSPVFVSQPCRTHGLSRDFNTICVFSHQCVTVQYDGRLMLKQWLILWSRQSFFLPVFPNFFTIFHIYRAHRCFMRILY